MSLRIWTVAIAVCGLLLYTLSLLPEAGTPPEPRVIPGSDQDNLALPGTHIYPLIYRDPALIEFTPDSGSLWQEPDLSTSPSRPLPESFDSSLRPYTNQINHLQEVLS